MLHVVTTLTTQDFVATRRQARISQQELADELDISRRALASFEADQAALPWSLPRIAYLEAIERIKARKAESKAS